HSESCASGSLIAIRGATERPLHRSRRDDIQRAVLQKITGISEWVSKSKRWRGLSRRRTGKTCPMPCKVIPSSYFSTPWGSFLLARNGPKCANCADDSLRRLAKG